MTKLLNCGQNQKATGQIPSVSKRFVRHKIAVAGIMDVAWCIRKVCLITPKHPCALEIISSSYTNIIFLISKLSRGCDGRIIYTSRCFTHYSGRIQIHKSWSTMYEECSVGTPLKDMENCADVEKRWGVQNVQRPRPHTHALKIRRRICARSPDICKPRAATWTYHFHSKLSNITMKVPSLLTTTIHIAVIALIGLGGSPLSVQ